MNNKNKFWKKKKENKKIFENKSSKYKSNSIKKSLKNIIIKEIENPIESCIIEYANHHDCSLNTIARLRKDKDFMERIFVNKIRHDFTNYIQIINKMKKLSEKDMIEFKEKVNELILKKYEWVEF